MSAGRDTSCVYTTRSQAKAAGRRGQAQPRGRARRHARLAQALPGAARVHELLPAADQLLHRLQRAPEQDRRGHHDAGRRMRVDDEPGADAEHRHLHALPRHARQRRQACRGQAEPHLLVEQPLVPLPPGADTGAHHAHADDDLGMARECLGVARHAARLRQRRLGGGTREPLGRERQQAECGRTGAGGDRQQRMHESDHQQVDRQPRRIEERAHAGAAEEAAQLRDVAQPLDLGAPAPRRGLLQRMLERGRRQQALQRAPGAGQCARARDVHAVRQGQRERGQHAQHQQRLHAAAREHAIEHLAACTAKARASRG
jgi:hypothetical protein